VDGRADLYGNALHGDDLRGDDLLRQFQTAVELRTGWRDVLDRWQVETVLVPPSCALAQALLLDPNWHVAFSDPKAIILLRTPPAAATAAPDPASGGYESEKMFPRAIINLRN
jgi:hypothetical protein